MDEAVEQLPSTVEDVLADHPEWTTTIQDGAVTLAKLASDVVRLEWVADGDDRRLAVVYGDE